MPDDTPKPVDGAAAPSPQPVPTQEAPTPAGLPAEKPALFSQGIPYELRQSKTRFRRFRDAYGVYAVWLLICATLAFACGLLAYTRDHEHHFWFHIFLELSISSAMLLLTVIFVERVLEYRRERERKERWALIRDDNLNTLETVLQTIVQSSVHDLLKESGIQHTSSAYQKVAQDLNKRREDLTKANDAEAMKVLAHDIAAWHDTLAPAFNMLRTVTVPRLLQSTRNRTLLRIVLGLDARLGHSEIMMISLRHPMGENRMNDPVLASAMGKLAVINLGVVALIVDACGNIRFYLEQAASIGLRDIDDWPEY